MNLEKLRNSKILTRGSWVRGHTTIPPTFTSFFARKVWNRRRRRPCEPLRQRRGHHQRLALWWQVWKPSVHVSSFYSYAEWLRFCLVRKIMPQVGLRCQRIGAEWRKMFCGAFLSQRPPIAFNSAAGKCDASKMWSTIADKSSRQPLNEIVTWGSWSYHSWL